MLEASWDPGYQVQQQTLASHGASECNTFLVRSLFGYEGRFHQNLYKSENIYFYRIVLPVIRIMASVKGKIQENLFIKKECNQIHFLFYLQEPFLSLYCKVWFEDNSDPVIVNVTGEPRSPGLNKLWTFIKFFRLWTTGAWSLLFHKLWTGGEFEWKDPSSRVPRRDTLPCCAH